MKEREEAPLLHRIRGLEPQAAFLVSLVATLSGTSWH
jgi:hypothetical protein